MKIAELALALAATILQLLLLVYLVAQRLQKQFPAFFACVSLSVVGTMTGLAVRNYQAIYLDIFWVVESLYVVLAFLALLEIFKFVFAGFYHIPWFRFLFPTIGIIMVCTAVIRSLLKPPAQASRAFTVIIFMELAVRFLQIGILFLFFALVQFFHMRWKQRPFGIALGFGISAAGFLVVFLLRSEFGTKLDYVVRIAPPIAYTLAVVVWLLTFISPEPSHPLQGPTPALTPEEMLAEVRQYSSTVKKILKR